MEAGSGTESGAPLERGTQSRDHWELEFSRIVAFSDGVFAIAMTLLVLTLDVPRETSDLTESLLDEAPGLLAYALSFAVIGRFWFLHHRFFAEVTHFDARLIVINLVYLGLIALIPFTTDVLGNYGDESAGVIPYAANVGLTSLVSSYLVWDAVRRGLTRTGMEWIIETPLRWRGFFVGMVFIGSIPLALLSPTLAELSWLTLFFVGMRDARRSRQAG